MTTSDVVALAAIASALITTLSALYITVKNGGHITTALENSKTALESALSYLYNSSPNKAVIKEGTDVLNEVNTIAQDVVNGSPTTK